MNEKPKRMDGYIRVSRRMGREGPGYISPDVQREAIQRWADYRRVEIVAWHFDEDESGGSQNRPGLREAMRRVLDGESDGIACWRLNRFARNVSEALDDVKALHARKPTPGALALVEEDIDPTGPFGEFILTMLLAMAALELNNLKASWRTAKERAMARGAKIGPTPFGYMRGEAGVLLEHPTDAGHVREAYRLAGEVNPHAAMSYLAANAPGRVWTTYTVRRFLANRSYLGESRYGPDMVNLTSHPPLVTRAAWEAAQGPEPERRRPAADFPLSGLATCGTCGVHLVGARGGPGLRVYRCAASLASYKGEKCPAAVTILADRLEEYVEGAVREGLDSVRVEAAGGGQGDDLEALEAAMLEEEAELARFAGDRQAARILGDGYHPALQERADAAEGARRAYRDAAEAVAAASATFRAAQDWEDMSRAEVGETLRRVLAVVEVRKGTGARGRHAPPLGPDRVTLIAHDPDVDAGVTAPD